MAAEMAAGDTGMYVCTRFSLLTADVLTYFSLSDSLRHALFAVSFNRLLANKGLPKPAEVLPESEPIRKRNCSWWALLSVLNQAWEYRREHRTMPVSQSDLLERPA